MKKISNFFVIALFIVAMVVLGNFTYNKYMKSKFQKMLTKSDSRNYELIEKFNNYEEKIKVYGEILLSESDDELTWVNGKEGNRVVLDKNSKIAVVTENSDSLNVVSLNHTYLTDYFGNDGFKFKYLGKEGKFYLIQFTDKDTKVEKVFYLNKDTKLIEKIVEKRNGADLVTEYEIKLDVVSKAEMEYPDLTGYDFINSSSNTNISEDQIIKDTHAENNTNNNNS